MVQKTGKDTSTLLGPFSVLRQQVSEGAGLPLRPAVHR
jgi:hypothetical protein